MKLATYLASKQLSLGGFAKMIEVRNARTVQRYIKHGRVPAPAVMERIAKATGGDVQPNDFYSDAAR